MYKIYQDMPFPPGQFNYFADFYENSVQNYLLSLNQAQQQQHVPPPYILPYSGVDLRCLPWSKVMEILEKQAETFKLFQLNAAYGYNWMNEQNVRLILEFNEQFRKEVELLTDEQSAERLSVFHLPSWPKTAEQQEPPKEPVVVVSTAAVEGSKKRKRTYNKRNVPKKLKSKSTEGVTDLTTEIDPPMYRYSPAVSPISPTMEVEGR